MKYLFASDMHGYIPYYIKFIDIILEEKPDKVFLLGDICPHGKFGEIKPVLAQSPAPIEIIEGNCDFTDALPALGHKILGTFHSFKHGERTVFLTHGHIYNKRFVPVALKRGDIFVYGHTHVPKLEDEAGIYFVNDGSFSPFADSYAVLDGKSVFVKNGGGEILFSENLKDGGA